MSTLKVSAIEHPSATSTAFTLNSDGTVTLGPNVNIGGGFASGTLMLFVQTTAPTGWTKSTTHNDKALRVVSGSASSGGSSNFSAVLNGSVGSTTLTTSQIPSHNHSITVHANYMFPTSVQPTGGFATPTAGATGSTGGGSSHTHSMDVAYVDVIIATKD